MKSGFVLSRRNSWRALKASCFRLLSLLTILAVSCCSPILAKSDPNWDKLLFKGNQLMGVAKNKEAASEFAKVVAKYPDAPQPHLALGRALKKAGQMGEAKAEFKKAIDLDSNLADAFYEYGCLSEGDKQYSDAAQAFERYLALKPEASQRRLLEDRIRFNKQSIEQR